MKLTTIPSQIRPPRSEDWLIDGTKVGTISQHDCGRCSASVILDGDGLGLTGWVIGTGLTREESVSDALRKLSMVSLHVSQTYTKIVAGIA